MKLFLTGFVATVVAAVAVRLWSVDRRLRAAEWPDVLPESEHCWLAHDPEPWTCMGRLYWRSTEPLFGDYGTKGAYDMIVPRRGYCQDESHYDA